MQLPGNANPSATAPYTTNYPIVPFFTATVPFSAVLVGVFLSSAVGLFFGIYPANKAARLDPIEALRAEL